MRFPRPLALLAALSLLAACSSPEDAGQSSATADAPEQAATEAPAAPAAEASTCALAISGNDAMQYDTAELKVPAGCTEVTLTLVHGGKLPATAMGHNWVLAKTEDMAGVVADGMQAGPDASYIKAGDARVIAHTKVVGGGETTSVTFSTAVLAPGGDYSFFCTFPGHSAMMKGKLVLG